ncbi:helix-turn-helix domain-containing protein [Bacillus mojavensis]
MIFHFKLLKGQGAVTKRVLDKVCTYLNIELHELLIFQKAITQKKMVY